MERITEVPFAAPLIIASNGAPPVRMGANRTPPAKKPASTRKRSALDHPPYFDMIKEAIVSLKKRSGSSQYAIAKYVEEHHKHLPSIFKKVLHVQLKRLVDVGKLVKVKGSYKLPPKRTPKSAANHANADPAAKQKTAPPKPNKRKAKGEAASKETALTDAEK